VPDSVPEDPLWAVVWIDRLEVAEPVLGVIPDGENWHFEAAGNPEHDRLTLLLKVPPISVAVTVSLAF